MQAAQQRPEVLLGLSLHLGHQRLLPVARASVAGRDSQLLVDLSLVAAAIWSSTDTHIVWRQAGLVGCGNFLDQLGSLAAESRHICVATLAETTRATPQRAARSNTDTPRALSVSPRRHAC